MDPRKATQGPGTAAAGSPRRLVPTKAKHRTSVVVLRDPQALSAFVPAWEELAAAALEPNVFYEHWMLLPALEAFGKDIVVVLVLLHEPHNPDAPAKLGALFPREAGE